MANDVPKLDIERATEYAPFHEFDTDELERLSSVWDVWETVDEQRPFDRKKCIDAAIDMRKDQWNNWVGQPAEDKYRADWGQKFGLLSKEEAAFWFELFCADGYYNGNWGQEVTKDDITSRVGTLSADAPFETFVDHFDTLVGNGYIYQTHYMLPRLMREIFDEIQVMEWLFTRFPDMQIGQWLWGFGPISEDHRERARGLVIDRLAGYDYQNAQYYDLNTYIPQMLHRVPWEPGIEGIVGEYVRRKNHAWQSTIVDLIYKLSDEHKAEEFLKKIKHSSDPVDVRKAFAWGGFEHVEILFKHVIWRNNNYNLNQTFVEGLKVRHPDVVEWCAHYWGKKAVIDGIIEQYMYGEGAHVVKGLVKLCSRRGRKRDWAVEWLRKLKDEGDENVALIEAMLEGEPDAAVKLVREEVLDHEEEVLPDLPDDKLTTWMGAVSGLQWPGGKDPEWFGDKDLSQIALKGGKFALPPSVVRGMMCAAAWAYPDEYPLKTEIGGYKDARNDKLKKNHEATRHVAQKALKGVTAKLFDVESFEHFALALFEKWHHDNVGEPGDWVIELAAIANTHAVADALDHYVRETKDWSESRRQKKCILRSIDALGTIDLPEARRNLVYISEHSQQTDFANRAKKVLEAYKKKMKVSEDEFADLAVPSFNLDPRGTRTFDYGPRQFKFVVKGRGEIEFVDEAEERAFQKLPPARKTDDREKVKVARAEYKLMRQPVMEVFAEQAIRMERAMLMGRSWPAKRWEKYVVHHPVLGHLARRLVWKIFDKAGEVLAYAMLDEENLLVDLEMEEYELGDDHYVGIVHPIELDGDQRQEWTDQLMDFEIIQPFDQIGRDVFEYGDEAEGIIQDIKDGKAHLLNERLIEGFKKGWAFGEKSWWWAQTIRLAPGDLDHVLDLRPSSGFSLTRAGKIQTTYGWQGFTSMRCIASKDLKKKEPKELAHDQIPPRLYSEAIKLLHDAAQYQ